MPQIRADLSHPESNLLAKAFGIELILDSRPPKGSLRGEANKVGIAAVTYEGGGADFLDHRQCCCSWLLKRSQKTQSNPWKSNQAAISTQCWRFKMAEGWRGRLVRPIR